MMLAQAPVDIIDTGIIPRLVQSVSSAEHQSAELALRLLHNLSFHEKGRKAMVSAGAIPKVNCLQLTALLPCHCFDIFVNLD